MSRHTSIMHEAGMCACEMAWVGQRQVSCASMHDSLFPKCWPTVTLCPSSKVTGTPVTALHHTAPHHAHTAPPKSVLHLCRFNLNLHYPHLPLGDSICYHLHSRVIWMRLRCVMGCPHFTILSMILFMSLIYFGTMLNTLAQDWRLNWDTLFGLQWRNTHRNISILGILWM